MSSPLSSRSLVRRALRQPWVRALDEPLRLLALQAAAQAKRALPPAPSLAATAALFDGAQAPLVLGHRGAMARAPENTLGAFQAALDDGAHGFELDVQLAGDAVPIVLHDDTLDRTAADATGLPLDKDSDELDALDVGTWFPGWGKEKVPRLAEVFSLCRAQHQKTGRPVVVNVELKGPTPHRLGLERRAVALIQAAVADGSARVIVSSFHPAQLLEVRRVDPSIPIGLLVDKDGLLPLRTAWAAPLLLPDAVHPPAAVVDEAFVAAAHAASMRVFVWSVPSDDEARRLVACGVDGLIVDDVRATVAAVA